VTAANDAERLSGAGRILVVGPSGAGKTQLALRLADLLGLPLIHLDAERWRPGWNALPDDEWSDVVAELTLRRRWIMDGTYEKTLGLRVPAADAVVVLEVGRLRCLAGLVRRRFLGGRRPRPDAPPGQRIDRRFLRYLWRYPSVTRPMLLAALREHGDGKTVLVLRDRGDARRLLEEVGRLRGGA